MLRQLAQKRGALQHAARAFSAQAAELATESPFLRFGSPIPQVWNLSGALAQLPETQVGGLIGVAGAEGGQCAARQPGPPFQRGQCWRPPQTCSKVEEEGHRERLCEGAAGCWLFAQVTRLPNGLRVASETTPFANTATVRRIAAGSMGPLGADS